MDKTIAKGIKSFKNNELETLSIYLWKLGSFTVKYYFTLAFYKHNTKRYEKIYFLILKLLIDIFIYHNEREKRGWKHFLISFFLNSNFIPKQKMIR